MKYIKKERRSGNNDERRYYHCNDLRDTYYYLLDWQKGEQMKKQQTQPITAYICSPYRGDTARNVAYARELVKEAIAWGFAPICPHLYLPQILDDDNPKERETALRVGLELLNGCSVLIVGTRYGISKGMQDEIKRAHELDMAIHYHG